MVICVELWLVWLIYVTYTTLHCKHGLQSHKYNVQCYRTSNLIQVYAVECQCPQLILTNDTTMNIRIIITVQCLFASKNLRNTSTRYIKNPNKCRKHEILFLVQQQQFFGAQNTVRFWRGISFHNAQSTVNLT